MATSPHRRGAGEEGTPGQDTPSPVAGGVRAKPRPCFIPPWRRGAQTDALVSACLSVQRRQGCSQGGHEAFLRHFGMMSF